MLPSVTDLVTHLHSLKVLARNFHSLITLAEPCQYYFLSVYNIHHSSSLVPLPFETSISCLNTFSQSTHHLHCTLFIFLLIQLRVHGLCTQISFLENPSTFFYLSPSVIHLEKNSEPMNMPLTVLPSVQAVEYS